MIKGGKHMEANRISIIGGSGTGKTTLATNLGTELNLPIYHIDGIHHLKNWEKRDKQERDQIVLEKIQENKWVIDGTYRTTLKKRLEKSDLVIYLDYSTFAQLKGVLGRYIKNHGKEKKEIPGCKEKMSLEFFLWVLHWRKNKRADIIQVINEIDNKKVIVFRKRKELNRWYQKEFGKEMSL